MDIDIKVLNDAQNQLLKRREMKLHATYTGKTPAKQDIKEEACKKFNLSPATTVITNVNQLYGEKASDITVHCYESAEAMSVEPKHLKAREQKKEKTGAETKPASEQKKNEKAEEPKAEK